VELILDAAGAASAATGVGIGVIIAANRTKHPLDAKTLARLAVRYADRGVVGFGLSNDERRGRAYDFGGAFRIARRGGLLSAPHGGELLGAASVWACLEALGADRVGHGVHAVEDTALVDALVARSVTLEVCPSSNVGMGVFDVPGNVPVRRLFDAGVPIALGADDPLLFGVRLVRQYELARIEHGFSATELATLARYSIRASAAPGDLQKQVLHDIDSWLAAAQVT
jgi:adenosine deaminase